MRNGRARGFFTLTLHAHLPWVLHHGTWPHGLEWLLEAAAETYLPLLRVIGNLRRDGLALKANISFSPVLLEQLRHPTFQSEFPQYLKRKIQAAREDEEFFRQSGDTHFAAAAQGWRRFFEEAAADFEALERDIVKGFRQAQEAGLIEVVTSCATHGYLPLLGTDESVLAQVRTGVAAHERHFGVRPRGMWSPECGYRPAEPWRYPVAPHGSSDEGPAVPRMGVEEALAESGIEYFCVDSHLLRRSQANLYRAHCVDGPRARRRPVKIFPRDPRTGLQVWDGGTGYPGEPAYLDFHKKRWPGGHRYWQVTDSRVDIAFKTPYYAERAAAKAREHAEHFVRVIRETLQPELSDERPPVLSAPFDAELFGHWWFEGPRFLEHVARLMAEADCPIAAATGSECADQIPAEGFLALEEGSWGRNGTSEVWLNPETAWTWSHIYAAEARVREIAARGRWNGSETGERIARQLCRELLLLESSDWQFLITTEAARDYAERRFLTHVEQFRSVDAAWEEFTATGGLRAETEQILAAIERRDSLFADLDPGLWSPVS